MPDPIDDKINFVYTRLFELQAEVLGTELAIKALIRNHSDPARAEAAVLNAIETYVSRFLGSTLSDGGVDHTVAGLAKAKGRMLSRRRTPRQSGQ